jgi:FixJ family two-component response regulator
VCGANRTAPFPAAEQFLESGCVVETIRLITDLQMPGMSGLDLQIRLRADGYDTPIIFPNSLPKGTIPNPWSEWRRGWIFEQAAQQTIVVECVNSADASLRH